MKKLLGSLLFIGVAGGITWHYLPQANQDAIGAFVGNAYHAYTNAKGSSLDKINSTIQQTVHTSPSSDTLENTLQDLRTQIKAMETLTQTQRTADTTATPADTAYYEKTDAFLHATDALIQKLNTAPSEKKSSMLGTITHAVQCLTN